VKGEEKEKGRREKYIRGTIPRKDRGGIAEVKMTSTQRKRWPRFLAVIRGDTSEKEGKRAKGERKNRSLGTSFPIIDMIVVQLRGKRKKPELPRKSVGSNTSNWPRTGTDNSTGPDSN